MEAESFLAAEEPVIDAPSTCFDVFEFFHDLRVPFDFHFFDRRRDERDATEVRVLSPLVLETAR